MKRKNAVHPYRLLIFLAAAMILIGMLVWGYRQLAGPAPVIDKIVVGNPNSDGEPSSGQSDSPAANPAGITDSSVVYRLNQVSGQWA
ncbi:hypothetical protein [Cohnella sp. AR92]|uniref:hypothetical protein n=1 Tax=Cohnella sp. AR92 TaxID=648716 RepID=UPI000F8D772E|nr:hypothetical protein [Cohnella sp. AR92]RUS45187.1 hypothetical protein ELR57_19915 [Cohnella sp. AR92]